MWLFVNNFSNTVSIAPRDPQVYVHLRRVEYMGVLSPCIIAPRDPQVSIREEV